MTERSIDRRTLVLSGAAAVALLGVASPRSARAAVVQSGGGIAGGGGLEADSGPAEFSVFGSQFIVEGQDTPLVFGSLSFIDVVANTKIESIEVTAYGSVEGSEGSTRQLSGTAAINGEGVHPFDLVLTDDGPIGAGADVFWLAVGADGASEVGEAIYEIQSVVQSGNLQLLTFDFGSGDSNATPVG